MGIEKQKKPSHPLAYKTSWSRNLHTDFSRMGRAKVVVTAENSGGEKLKMSSSVLDMVVAGIVILGLVWMGVDLFEQRRPDMESLIVVGVFMLASLWWLKKTMNKEYNITMDNKLGKYWIGAQNSNNNKNGDIDKIGACQIHKKFITKKRDRANRQSNQRDNTYRYYSYELNLVFNDGTRYTLQDSRNYDLVVSNASKIGSYLDIPVWSGENARNLVCIC